ncbi:hypothetical protein AV530_015900 [Patagioenas fasciata monilis]|uniref:Uncharacterized protein n=1 Tax=Patagioenas fasciata monilis TaxID=372326 RepID=A0A1V4KJ56_PATFA|nr:hypothetical protein AV530_015900 [Patagioenas fasciata monilis]
MAARGACQHGAVLPSCARLCGWRRERPRDAFNRAARDLRRRGARPRRWCAGDQSSLILVLGQAAIGWTINSPAGTEVTGEHQES